MDNPRDSPTLFTYTAFKEAGANRLLKVLLNRGWHSPSLMVYDGIMYSFTMQNEGLEND